MALWIVLAAVVLFALLAVLAYNGLVVKRNRAENSWAQVDVQLRRRYDLIPNLVEAVKGYAKHEKETFENVTKARSAAVADNPPAQQAGAENILGAMLGRLMVVAEAYPELRATENFQQLQNELSETENQIQITRRVYNDTVQTYNTFIQIFPPSAIAGAFGFEPREFYDAPSEAEATPKVSFDGGKAEAPPAEK